MQNLTKTFIVGAFALLATAISYAADTLDASEWRSIDDATGKPKALVHFKQLSNGTLTATLVKRLDTTDKVCNSCEGTYKGKPLEGITLIKNLHPQSGGKYDGGTILDPKTGKSYKMKAELSPDGKKLTVRGYVGFSLLGRSQTWLRAN